MSTYVLLRHNGKIIGTAKYLTTESTGPTRVLHGLPLKRFARQGEDLVVVYHVQIFMEYLNVPYPFSFGGSESPPSTLRDMNQSEKHFKALIALDNNELLPHDWGCDLRDQPQSVSKNLLATAGGEASSSKLANSGMMSRLQTVSEIPAISPFGTEGTMDRNASATTAQFGNTSFGGKRFFRLRGKATSSTSVFCSTGLDTNARELQNHGLGNEIEQETSSDRIYPDSRNINGYITDEDIEESRDEQHTSRGSHVAVRASVFDPDECMQEGGGDANIGDFSTGVFAEEDENTSDQGNRALVDTTNDVPREGEESSEVDSEEEGELDQGYESTSDPSVEPKDCAKVFPVPRKRAYVHHIRKRGVPVGPRDLRKRRKTLSQRTDNPFLRGNLQCCKSFKCFDNIDPIFAFKTYKEVMRMNREDFKSFLISLYDAEDRCFSLQSRRVCARYLQKGFGFSNDLQCSVKCTAGALSGPTAAALPRVVLSRKRDAIINFLQDYAEAVGDMMPNAMFTNLPEFRRKDVYEKLKRHFQRHFSNEEPPSLNFFYAVWKSECKNVRTRRNHGFARCEICIFFKNEIADNQKRKSIVRRARESLREHLNMVKQERRMYRHRCERARKQPKKYISMVVDGADQTAFGLPHLSMC